MLNENIKNTLANAKVFISKFSADMTNPDITDAAKQVYFLDNQTTVKATMEELSNIKTSYESLGVELVDDDAKAYEMSTTLMNRLTKVLTDYRNSYATVKADVTVEDTTAVVTTETISDAAKNNSSTQKIIKDMNELNENASVAQIQEFTHAILVGKKFVYTKATTKQELNTFINQIAEANPNENVSVYEVVLNKVPLKTKTTYTV